MKYCGRAGYLLVVLAILRGAVCDDALLADRLHRLRSTMKDDRRPKFGHSLVERLNNQLRTDDDSVSDSDSPSNNTNTTLNATADSTVSSTGDSSTSSSPSNETDSDLETVTKSGLAATVSVVHPSLQFPIAQSRAIEQGGSESTASKYCAEDVAAAVVRAPAIGSSVERYGKAVSEAISASGFNGTVNDHPSTDETDVDSFLELYSKISYMHRFSLSPVSSMHFMYGSCRFDGDCASLGPRKYCVESICRECRSESQSTDCPNTISSAELCSAETEFTCSDCVSDDYCSDDGAVCRFVFPGTDPVPMMPRKQCTLCAEVPINGEILSLQTCEWRCPYGTFFDQDESVCVELPVCAVDEFLAPTTESDPHYYTVGVNTTSPVCDSCGDDFIGKDVYNSETFCADIVAVVPGKIQGTLADETLPCSTFECRSGFVLNANHDQCERCKYTSCPVGQFLEGCGGVNPGACTLCDAKSLPQNSTWVDLKKVDLVGITDPRIACLSVCVHGFYMDSNSTCVDCDLAEKQLCPVGQILKECGPGQDEGNCELCPPIEPGNYFTGSKCQVASCEDRDATQCAPGTALVGCGGVTAGECQACPGGLPTGATAWTKGCDFMCSAGTYRSGNACLVCDSARQCPDGTMLTGCGSNGINNGTCIGCPRTTMGFFYDGEHQCKPQKCNPNSCLPNERLVGCGYGLGGDCVSCGRIPAGVDSYTRMVDPQTYQTHECLARCKQGFYGIDNTCQPCANSNNVCRIGQYLAGCGTNSFAGKCTQCDPHALQPGEYWTGGPLCEHKLCADNLPKCKDNEFPTPCGIESESGGFGPSSCKSCSSKQPLPVNAVAWTSTDTKRCVPRCAQGFVLDDSGACSQCDSENDCQTKPHSTYL